jgi:hypothetical protein
LADGLFDLVEESFCLTVSMFVAREKNLQQDIDFSSISILDTETGHTDRVLRRILRSNFTQATLRGTVALHSVGLGAW